MLVSPGTTVVAKFSGRLSADHGVSIDLKVLKQGIDTTAPHDRHDRATWAPGSRAPAQKDRPVSRVFTDAAGERHWGVHGAAGLLVRNHSTEDGLTRYLLQRRGALVMHGGTWSTPGGAIDRRPDGSLETPLEAALREVREECGAGLPDGTVHVRTMRRDFGAPYGQPGSWSYHTVMMNSPVMFDLGAEGSWEHGGSAWFTPDEMAALPLHPAFVDTALSLGMPRPRKDGHR